MLPISPYLLTTLLSSTIILVMGICLFFVSVPREPQLRNYRISRRFLGVAYLFLSVVGQWEVFGGLESEGDNLVLAFTVIAASYQSFLFTFSIITLINLQYMTARRVWSNIIPISVLSVALLAVLFTASDRVFNVAFYTALALYCLQLILYIVLFAREYRRYRLKLDNFFSENEEQRMRWIQQSFYMAAGVGVIAVVSLFVSTLVYTIFTAAYTMFYIYFAVKYINYVTLFHRIAPVVVVSNNEDSQEESRSGEEVGDVLDKWIAQKGFLNSDITLGSLARDLHTNQSYLSRHINSEYGQNFRAWISSLRIGESMRLIESRRDLSMDDLADQIGIPSRSTFYRQFTSVAGMSPAEYRKAIQSRDTSDSQ